MITHIHGKLNLSGLSPASSEISSDSSQGGRILTEPEMQELEKKNIINALEASNWKVYRDKGAASLLLVPPPELKNW